jgi:hypothetical protein
MKGKVLITTAGAYSDYRIIAVLEWLSDETPDQAKERYLEIFPAQRKDYSFDEHKFVGWLVREGRARDFDAYELHVTGYGNPSEWESPVAFKRAEW